MATSAPLDLRAARRGLHFAVRAVSPSFVRRSSMPEFGDHARRTQDIQHAGAEAEQQEDDQPPGRRSRQAVDNPAEAGADRDSGDELAGQLQRLAVAGRAADVSRRPPLAPRPAVSPQAMLRDRAGGARDRRRDTGIGAARPGPVLPVSSGRFAAGHRNLPARPAGQPSVRFKVARNIVRGLPPSSHGGSHRTHGILCNEINDLGEVRHPARAHVAARIHGGSRSGDRLRRRWLSSSRRHRCGRRCAGRSSSSSSWCAPSAG